MRGRDTHTVVPSVLAPPGVPLKGDIYRNKNPAKTAKTDKHQLKLTWNGFKWRREGVQRHRTAYSSVLVEYQPVGTHGGPIQTHFHWFSDIFRKCKSKFSKLFSKKWISRGSSGQTVYWKMIIYWSSNFHKFIIKWDLTAFLQVTFHFFMDKTRFSFGAIWGLF